jgi:membrane fusion protein (multidrug efflux system)
VSRIRWVLLVLIVLAGGVVWWKFKPASPVQPSGPTAEKGAAAGPSGRPSPGVEVKPVVQRDLQDELVATGEFRAVESVLIRPEVAGRVAKIHFKDGARVQAGDLLISLDDALIQAELAQSEAEARLAESNRQRAEDLFAQRFISSRALDEARANASIAAARRDLARARLARTQIRAPFAGQVGLRQISPGGYVKEGEALVSLEDSEELFFDFRVPERYAHLVQVNQGVRVEADALEKPLTAKVAAVDARVEADGRFLQIRSRVQNSAQRLRSGVFGRARLTVLARLGALVVSEEALVGEKAGYFVWKVQDGKVAKVPVQVGLRLEREVEVRGDLTAGDQVVIAGQLKIRSPGQSVRVLGGQG